MSSLTEEIFKQIALTDNYYYSMSCSFYTSIFEHQFKQCMEFPAQHRYSIAFPMVCAHFMQATHELCPEEVSANLLFILIKYAHKFENLKKETNILSTSKLKKYMCFYFLQRHSIGTTSVQYAHWFLKEMSEEVNQVITAICEEQCMLSDKVCVNCGTVQGISIGNNCRSIYTCTQSIGLLFCLK